MGLVQRTKNGQLLYAIVYAVGERRVDIEYVHAENATHARAQFWAGKIRHRATEIIEAAPVVGFFENETGIHT